MVIKKRIMFLLCLVLTPVLRCMAVNSSQAAAELFSYFASEENHTNISDTDLLKTNFTQNDLINGKGQTFWHVIAQRGDDLMIKLFGDINNNQQVCNLINNKDKRGNTALYYLASGTYEKKHEVVKSLFSMGVVLDLPAAKHIVKDPDWNQKYSGHEKQIIEVVSQTWSYYVGSFFLGVTMPFFKNSLLNSFALYATGGVADWFYVYRAHKLLSNDRNRADISAMMYTLGAAARHVFRRFVSVPMPNQWPQVKNAYPWLKPTLHGFALFVTLVWLKSLSVAL